MSNESRKHFWAARETNDFSTLMTQFMFALITSAAEQKLEADNAIAVLAIAPPSPTPEYINTIKTYL